MTQRTQILALAGLLHDIGKFMLRAAESGNRLWDAEAKGDFKYKHAMLTATFVQRYVPEQWRAAVELAAGDHHNPQRWEDRVVTLADYLSAAERNDGIEDDDVRKTHPRQLLSIFSAIKADGHSLAREQRERAYLPLAPLALDKNVLFPAEPLDGGDVVWKQYHDALWLPFTAAADRLKQVHEPDGDLSTYLESLLLLMQRYTWCIPSAYYNSVPDISLYDHGRMTAALAAVLADSGLDDVQLQELIEKPQTDRSLALLVGADISGVQDFIYTITSRGATSALRGRSFYLQLLTEAIARYVLRQLELPITNLLYAGGGNFYILARPADGERLTAIRRHISRALLQHHRGDLYVALTGKPLAGRDFFEGRLSQTWGQLHERLQWVKRHRFAELEEDDLQWLFKPHGDGGNEDRQCQVCGMEHEDTRTYKDEAGNEVRKCPPCLSYEELGKQLRRARYLLLQETDVTTVDLDAPAGRWHDALAAFGLAANVGQDVQEALQGGHGQKPSVLLALRDDKPVWRDLVPARNRAVGRRFLVNVTPILQEDEYYKLRDKVDDLPRHRADGGWADPVKPFSVLAEQADGIKRLGVLRLDVDNLGRLFSQGLGENATISRVASLSFAVSLYFEGWVEKLAETMPGDQLYSIYSGGDDLFFVGSWDVVVEFARRVRADLTRYAAGHPGIHASAGIVLIGGKYPLAQAAGDAGQAEGAAKARQAWRDGSMKTVKDAICFLGKVQSWEQFGLGECQEGMGSVHQLMHLLVNMTKGNGNGSQGAPKALIRNLSRLYAQQDTAEQARRDAGQDTKLDGEPQPLWGPWMWRGYYTLRRMAKRNGLRDVEDLAEALHDDRFRNMDWIGLAARWAELLSR